MLEKIKNWFDEVIEDIIQISDAIGNTKHWCLFAFLKGHVIGCVIIYWLIVLSALVTGKVWNLEDRDQ